MEGESMRKLENLKPERVFYYFEELSKIPRESGNEKAVSDFLIETAKKLGLEGYTVVNLIEPFKLDRYKNAFYNKNDYMETKVDEETSSCG